MKKLALLFILQAGSVLLVAENRLAVNLPSSSSTAAYSPMSGDLVLARDGAFIIWSRDALSLRLPQSRINEFTAMLKSLPGGLLDLVQSSEEVRTRIEELQAQIKSRRDGLQKNLAIMGKTNVVNTLDIEREISSLIGEIEQRQGELRFLSYRLRVAFITLAFHFKKTTRPVNQGSAFPAIRSIDMYEFISRMRERYEKAD